MRAGLPALGSSSGRPSHHNDSGFAAFVPDHGGGSAADFHRFPLRPIGGLPVTFPIANYVTVSAPMRSKSRQKSHILVIFRLHRVEGNEGIGVRSPGGFEEGRSQVGVSRFGNEVGRSVSRQTINELLRGHRAVSPEMALRLVRLFGNSPEFWLNAQRVVDLWDAAKAAKDKIERITPLERDMTRIGFKNHSLLRAMMAHAK